MKYTLSTAIYVLVTVVAAAMSTRYFYPSWPLAVLYSLQLHASIACALAAIVALVCARHLVGWTILSAATALGAHAVVLSQNLATRSSSPENASGVPIVRLLTFNVLSNNSTNPNEIVGALINSGADVVNIMEAAPIKEHLDQFNRIYPYRIGCGEIIEGCDQMMLSRFPLEVPLVRTLSGIFPQRFISARVSFPGYNFTLVGIHTTKPYFDNFHLQELGRASKLIQQISGPLIVSGDFNASTISPALQDFLRATELRHHEWEPATWPIFASAFGVAIDHVYIRAPLAFKTLSRLPEPHGSNHYGLISEIALNSGNQLQ